MPKNNLFTWFFSNQGSKIWKVIFVVVGLTLLYLTLMPSIHVHSHYRHMDKIFHFIGFGAFAFFFSVAYPKIKYYLIILCVSFLGVFVEILQSFIPRRAFSYLDMLADFTGVVFALLFLALLRTIFSKLAKKQNIR